MEAPASQVPYPACTGHASSGSARILADQAQRDAATSDLSRCFIVEAAAGTGKTTILVTRILNIVREGLARLSEVAAITFTEKAAGELKARLREEIEKALSTSSLDEEIEQRLRQALSDLEEAQVSTIHSFAATLLRERPVEAGVDPDFEVLDENGEQELFSRAWEEWLLRNLGPGADPLRRALYLGLELDKVKGVARHLCLNRDLLPSTTFPRVTIDVGAFLQEFRCRVAELLTLAENHCTNPADAGYVVIQELKGWGDRLEAMAPQERERCFLEEVAIKTNRGNKGNWNPPGKCAEQKDLCRALHEELEGFKVRLKTSVMVDLVEWLRGFVDYLEGEKRRLGVLDFQDLLLLARDLVRDHPEVRAYFQHRFRYILVDEFQDTDPLQAELVFFLAEEGASARSWEEVNLSPGRLFIVGDPKQSIYRFRRADLEMYEQAKAVLTRSGAELQVFQNFRSRPSVIDWVNAVFSSLIQPSEDGRYQPRYVAMSPFRQDQGQVPGVVFLAASEVAGVAPARRADEGRRIARFIRRVVEERWPVVDPDSGSSRPIGYRDVAVLFPATTNIDLYEEALREEGVPYRLESGKQFFARQEVRSLAACLSAIDNPGDKLALVAALKSTYFGFSDEEIFLFAAGGGTLNYLRDPGEDWPGLREAFSLLRDLHRRRNEVPVSRLVETFLARTMGLEAHFLKHGGTQAVANLQKVVDQARALETAGGMTLRRFARWLREMEALELAESDSPTAEPGEEAAMLLTVHKAKGLEFPLVVLANLGTLRPSQRRSVDFVVDRLRGSFEVCAGGKDGFRSPGFQEALAREQRRMEAEERRLFYVAATRARDYLVIPLPSAKTDGYQKYVEGYWPAGYESGGAAVASHGEAGAQAGLAGAGVAVVELPTGEGSIRCCVCDPYADIPLAGELPAPPTTSGVAPITPQGLPGAPQAVSLALSREERVRAGSPGGEGVSESVEEGRVQEVQEAGKLEASVQNFNQAFESWSAMLEQAKREASRGIPLRRASGQQEAGLEAPTATLCLPLAPAGSGGVELGSAFHAVMQRIDLADPDTIPPVIAAVAGEQGLEDKALLLEEWARKCCDTPVMQRARRARRVFREMPFSVMLEGTLVEGLIDLAFEEDDGLVLVDYKTDNVWGAGLEERFSAYRQQVGTYVAAINHLAGLSVREAHIIFARLGVTRSLTGS